MEDLNTLAVSRTAARGQVWHRGDGNKAHGGPLGSAAGCNTAICLSSHPEWIKSIIEGDRRRNLASWRLPAPSKAHKEVDSERFAKGVIIIDKGA